MIFTVIFCRAARELKNEAKAHILNHKNVVILHATIFEPGHYGIVLEFVPNGCLEDYIDQNKVLFNETSVIFMCTILLVPKYNIYSMI